MNAGVDIAARYSYLLTTLNHDRQINLPEDTEATHINWPERTHSSELAEDEIHVWCVDLGAEVGTLETLRKLLSPDECERADRFYFEVHRRRFAVGRAFLRCILAAYRGVPPVQIKFGYSQRGKPYVAEPYSSLHFNLAHSGNLALCAVTRRSAIGVDVECIRPIEQIEGIARRFFSAAETERLLSLPPENRADAFFNCWTRKEAFLKATGDGITAALDRFEVSLEPGAAAELRAVYGQPEEASHWTFWDLRPGRGYVGALAIRQRDLRVQCWRWLVEPGLQQL